MKVLYKTVVLKISCKHFVFTVRLQPYRGTLKFILHSKGKWDYVSITNISGTTRSRNKKSHPGNLFTAFERTIQSGEFYTGPTSLAEYLIFYKKRDTPESFQFPRATENNSVVINFVREVNIKLAVLNWVWEENFVKDYSIRKTFSTEVNIFYFDNNKAQSPT